MAKKAKKRKHSGIFGGLTGLAEQGIKGRAQKLAEEEAKQTGTKAPSNSWGKGVKRNK